MVGIVPPAKFIRVVAEPFQHCLHDIDNMEYGCHL